jgi:cytochrome P450
MSGTSATATYAIREDVPEQVPAELVYAYDVFQPGPPGSDIFEELFKLKDRAPPIFWTPYNGGHWYVTDSALAEQVLSDNVHFSSQVLMLPREANPPPGRGFAPIHLDPPEHGLYRRIMQMALGRKFVVDALPGIRAFAIGLIEALKPKGRCDFIADFGYELPTQVFLSLVDLPERYATPLKARVHGLHDVTSDKAQLFVEINEILVPFVRERMADPGDDLVSWLAAQEIDGAPVTEERLHSMTTLLLIAGLGTIADTFGCIAGFLADHPEHRRWIRDNPDKTNGVVDELLRRFPVTIAGTVRLCVGGAQVGDALVKSDELILAPPAMMNFDERTYPNPLEVDFERRISVNTTFGFGPHRCPGAALTRAQLSILIEEWLNRIPEFRISPSEATQPTPGINVSYERLIFEWPTD